MGPAIAGTTTSLWVGLGCSACTTAARQGQVVGPCGRRLHSRGLQPAHRTPVFATSRLHRAASPARWAGERMARPPAPPPQPSLHPVSRDHIAPPLP